MNESSISTPTLLSAGEPQRGTETSFVPPPGSPPGGEFSGHLTPTLSPHGAEREDVKPHCLPDVDGPMSLRRTLDAAVRDAKLQDIIPLRQDEKLTWREIERRTGVHYVTARRYYEKHKSGGFNALLDNLHKCGGKTKFPELNELEVNCLRDIFLHSNKGRDAASMRSAAESFVLQPGVREEIRAAVLPVIEQGRVPGALKKVLERVTPTHIAMHRRPKLTSSTSFSGNVGAFVEDMRARRRVIESDDGTLNFAAWIPWDMGGDPCSDRFHVRLGRWQFLPAVDAGWTRMYLTYAIVCRPRGSYRKEDVRSLIYTLARAHGLPDCFRFERGTWESDDVVRLVKALGVELDTVYSPNQKPIVEGGFNVLWEYLSQLDGQVGRYRGDEEAGNQLVQKCRAGRADPRDHFPSLAQCVKALDGAMFRANDRTIDSIYGKIIPSERHELLKVERPWRQLPETLEYQFCPFVREWTVAKGTVGGDVPILEDYSAPFYFAHEELWRWNGHKVRLYFDLTASPCLATVESVENYHGYRADEIICRAELLGGLPHFCRAARGWADEQCERQVKWRGAALSALRRDNRALGPRGQITAAVREDRDGSGSFTRASVGQGSVEYPNAPRNSQGSTESHPTRRGRLQPTDRNLLARQAQLARSILMETEG